MVHAKAAVTPSSEKVMEEDDSSGLQHYTSLVNVQADVESLVTSKSRAKTHRRHQSLFSSSSAPIDDHKEPSSNNESVLRKSTSGNLNWKLGEFWSKLRGPAKENTAPTSLTIDAISEKITTLPIDQKTVEKQALKTETLGVQEIDGSIGARKPPFSKKERRTGELWQSRAQENDLAEAVSPSASSTSRSLHFTSLNVSTSSKFSSSGDLGASNTPIASPREQSGQSETSELTPTLSSQWREIQGANNWNGLLDPLDLDLRREILRYGDLAQLTQDNFECNTRSKYAGSARYPKQKLFNKLYKQYNGYEVTKYLYATSNSPLPGTLHLSLSSESWDVDSNWMGYVAIATDEQEIQRLGRREIVVAWRGAVGTIEWLVDAQALMAPIRVANPKLTEIQAPKVQKGFWSLYTSKRATSQFNQNSASEQIIIELTRLLALHKGENLSITLTGHGLGGALAILTAYEVAARGLHKQGDDATIPVTVFTFGSPHVGDGLFRKKLEEFQVKVLRVVNVHDVVPKSIANFYPLWGSSDASKHVGVELQLDHKLSTYLKPTRDPLDWHNLECYLHHVDGYLGAKSKSFELVTNRDFALVNKAADVLLERLCVPAHWWQVEKKGLELSAEGRWVEASRAEEDTPSLANHERFV